MLAECVRGLLNFYATRLPYHRGKWRIIEAVLRASGIEARDRGRTFDVVRSGLRWRLDPRCAVQRRLLYHGALDRFDERELFARLPAGGVFFDIGSYFGYYALRAARCGARAFACEPLRANFELLAAHQSLNPLAPLHAFQLALSDKAGRAQFIAPEDGNRGRGRLCADGDAGAAEGVTVTTLDAFAREHALDRLDALKLDVEGAELKVLAGGREAIARFRPIMLLELNPPCLARFGADKHALLASVHELGYATWRAAARGIVPFERLASNEDYINILCLPR